MRGVRIKALRRREVVSNKDLPHFEEVFENAAIGIALVGTDGRWLRVNRSLCEIIGYSERELTTKTSREITYPEDLDADLDQLERVLRGEIRTYQVEKRYFHKLGHVVWTLLSVSLVRNIEGEPLYLISQIQDISERKALEQELSYHHPVLRGARPARTHVEERSRISALQPGCAGAFEVYSAGQVVGSDAG